jgi:hypothetical protein
MPARGKKFLELQSLRERGADVVGTNYSLPQNRLMQFIRVTAAFALVAAGVGAAA